MKHCKFVPDGLALLQDSPDTFQLSSERWITVIVGEAHALDVPACVFFSGCWIWVTEWDPGVARLLLLPPRIYVHAVTGSTSSTGFISMWRETRPCDPDQIMEKCAYCQGPPHSPTDCPTIVQGAGPSASQERTKPTCVPAKPKESSTTDKYPDHPIKPLPKRAREPRP